jgi:hypothetical protein
MDMNLADAISAFPALKKTQMFVIWGPNFSEARPTGLRKELMVPILAWRMQTS